MQLTPYENESLKIFISVCQDSNLLLNQGSSGELIRKQLKKTIPYSIYYRWGIP